MLQVERQALLVAVKGLEKVAVLDAEEMRSHVAAHIAAILVIFDLDDFCTEIREVRRAERSGAVLLDRKDTQAGQWKFRIVSRHWYSNWILRKQRLERLHVRQLVQRKYLVAYRLRM